MAQLNQGIIVPLFRKVANGFQKVFITASNIIMKDNSTNLQSKIDSIDSSISTLNSNFYYSGYSSGNMNVSKNLLHVSLPDGKHYINQSSYFYIPPNDQSFVNVPPILQGKEVIGYREVLWSNQIHVLVKITELYPIYGRQHYNFFNVRGWSGWKVVGDTGVGESAETGSYGAAWGIQTNSYWDIGNRKPTIDNEYFRTTQENSGITVKQAGVYIVECSIAYAVNATNTIIWAQINVNNSTWKQVTQYTYQSSVDMRMTGNWVLPLPANAVVNCKLALSAGAATSRGQDVLKITRLR